MKNFNSAIIKAQCKANQMKERMGQALTRKDLGGKEVIVEVGLVVIAVALLFLFRNEIKDFVETLMDNTTSNITNLFGEAG